MSAPTKAILKKVDAPEVCKGFEISPANYLIDLTDGCNFLVHRELEPGELQLTNEKDVFKWEGKYYIAMIANFESEEKAMAAIHSWWRASISLNKLNEKKKGKYEYIK